MPAPCVGWGSTPALRADCQGAQTPRLADFRPPKEERGAAPPVPDSQALGTPAGAEAGTQEDSRSGEETRVGKGAPPPLAGTAGL